jgi:CRISPR/Cas system-associated endoribonuclease Cas2
MGTLELESRKRTKKDQLKKILLGTVQAAGLLAIALAAPKVISAMDTLGLIPSRRQNEVIERSYRKLIRAGLIVKRGWKYELTPKGVATLRTLELREYQVRKPRSWDHKWRILVFDIPEYRRGTRQKLRRTLQSIGFYRLQNSVWVYPYDCEDLIALIKADFKIGKDVLYLIVDAVEGERKLKRQFGLK